MAGYGTTVDFDQDGSLGQAESTAVRATIRSLPVLLDESRTPSSRLAYAYNASRGIEADLPEQREQTVFKKRSNNSEAPASAARSSREGPLETEQDKSTDTLALHYLHLQLPGDASPATQDDHRNEKDAADDVAFSEQDEHADVSTLLPTRM